MRAGGTLRCYGGAAHALACAGRWHFWALAPTWAQGKKKAARLSGFCLCAGAGVSPSSSATYASDEQRLSPLLANRHTLALTST
jgi:hypothetical protein